MSSPTLATLGASIAALKPVSRAGVITGIAAGRVEASGLGAYAALGDQVRILDAVGEIVGVGRDSVSIVADGLPKGLKRGTAVTLIRDLPLAPDDSWLGRVVDPDGRPLDGRPVMRGPRIVGAANDQPKRGLGARIETGVAVLNTLLPLVKGQRVGLFAGSGVGKSTLLAQLARTIEADVIVIALVGERAREVREFVEDTLGAAGLARSVVIAATAEAAPHLRRRCADSATTVAEYFRDQGKHVLLLMDSLTRFAEAHREVAVAAGETANLRGHPASTPAALARLCERTGPGRFGAGDITAIYTVLVAGSDMEEPVADMVRGLLDGHIVLDRTIAEGGRFPAINVLRSVSRSLPGAASTAENGIIADARDMMAAYDGISVMRRAGLYAPGSDGRVDDAVACHEALEKFLSLMDGRAASAHFAALKQALSHGTKG